jgi:F-type H+-transporting ATPase subunit delta
MGQRAAKRYAEALIDLSKEQKSMDVLLKQTGFIEKTLKQSSDLRSVLNSPVVKAEDKQIIAKSVFKSVDEMLHGLFDLLAENNRFDHLKKICQSYGHTYNQMHNIQEAHITSAIELDKKSLKALKAKIKDITGDDAQVTTETNENLIGGFVLQLNDLQYDASISGQLSKIKRNLYN